MNRKTVWVISCMAAGVELSRTRYNKPYDHRALRRKADALDPNIFDTLMKEIEHQVKMYAGLEAE